MIECIPCTRRTFVSEQADNNFHWLAQEECDSLSCQSSVSMEINLSQEIRSTDNSCAASS